jgi:hypothetical protein
LFGPLIGQHVIAHDFETRAQSKRREQAPRLADVFRVVGPAEQPVVHPEITAAGELIGRDDIGGRRAAGADIIAIAVGQARAAVGIAGVHLPRLAVRHLDIDVGQAEILAGTEHRFDLPKRIAIGPVEIGLEFAGIDFLSGDEADAALRIALGCGSRHLDAGDLEGDHAELEHAGRYFLRRQRDRHEWPPGFAIRRGHRRLHFGNQLAAERPIDEWRELLAKCCGVDAADLTDIDTPRAADLFRVGVRSNQDDGLNIHAERRCIIALEQIVGPDLDRRRAARRLRRQIALHHLRLRDAVRRDRNNAGHHQRATGADSRRMTRRCSHHRRMSLHKFARPDVLSHTANNE